ncbi:MAG: N-acetylmuramoyl-L-alanine amidase [Defluviitaleaceae bacterium]|nr:N-acetylmuramoyl-L-alanine amidase [Defluviitaleaceae bacterium]MCL2239649.1 N-acetylmuramoyl-L-alanine amidase [Defluviitaleaceae bacterium]
MNIVRKPSPNINTGRQGHTPDMIVCHITDGGFEGAVSWLTNPESRVSSHFVVARDGRITQLVELTDTAWANGTSGTKSNNQWHGHSTLQVVRERNVNANRYTISIEHEGRHAETAGALAPAQLEATIFLIGHIRSEVKRLFGLEIPMTRQHIVGHHEITPRTRPNCPGRLFPFDEIIRRLSENTAQPAPQNPSASPSNFAREAWEWAVQNNLIDGTNPREPATREQLVTILLRFNRMLGN